MTLVTTQDVRQALGWEPDRDPDCARLALEITALWEEQTARQWLLRSEEVYIFEPDWNEKRVHLPLYPLTALDVQAWDNYESEPTDWTTTLDVNDDYDVVMSEGVVVLHKSYTYWRFRMSGGFTAASLLTAHPQGYSIRAALLEQLKYQEARNKPEIIAANQVAAGQTNANLKTTWYHPTFRAAAAKFRLG